MTADLYYLALTALLTGLLWIPYVVCQSQTNGFLRPANYVDPTMRPVPAWGLRANRAHVNAVESLAPFAVLVLIAHVAGKVDGMLAFWAAWFFWMRLAHAVVYLAGLAYVRTIVFTLGFVAVLGVFWGLVN